MPTLKIGQTTKKINSTMQVNSWTYELDCKLKEPCSMHDPVFQVQGISNKDVFYNYCKFNSNYYWIDDIRWLTNNIQELHCHLDPLATFKYYIENTKAYCIYGDAAHWNQEIDDIRFSPEVECDNVKIITNNVFRDGTGSGMDITIDGVGCVIMVYIEQTPSVEISGMTPVQGWKPGVNTIVMPVTALTNILGDLTGQLQNNTDDVSTANTFTDYEFIQMINKSLGTMGGNGSWRDCILSLQWMPIDINFYNNFGYAEDTIAVGGVQVACAGWGVRRIPNIRVVGKYYDLMLPWHDETVPAYGGHHFIKNSRWSSFNIYALGQTCQLDTSQLKNQYKITVFWAVNIITGQWSLRILEGTEGYASGITEDETLTLGFMSGTLGIDILYLAGNGIGVQEIAGHLVSSALPVALGAIGAITGGAVGAIAGTSVGNIVTGFLPSTINSTPTPSGAGGADITAVCCTKGANLNQITIIGKQWKPVDIANYGLGASGGTAYCDLYGYPCNKFMPLSQISGYVKCSGASVLGAPGMTEQDRSNINAYLNSGIYIE